MTAAKPERPRCVACGRRLRRPHEHNLQDHAASIQPPPWGTDRLKPTQCRAGATFDDQPPAWGDYGDNLVCGLRCGWELAVRLVATFGATREQVLEMLPERWRPPPEHNHPTRVVRAVGLCPACDYQRALGAAKKKARRDLDREAQADAEQVHEECSDCDALIFTHRAGRTHCLCGGDWPCPAAVLSVGKRGACAGCGRRRKVSGHLNREVCSSCRKLGMATWSFARLRAQRERTQRAWGTPAGSDYPDFDDDQGP